MQFVSDLHRHVTRPAFGGVEGHDADGMTVLALHKIADQRLTNSVFRAGLAPGAIELTEVLPRDVGVLVGPVGHN
jgi:hypothetical protein